MTRQETWLKVGELAKRVGLTVRALHHYDELGLLRPAGRASAGSHRLYGPQQLERLQRIVSLRAMGFSLEQIQAMLDRPEQALRQVLDAHIEHLDAAITAQQRLRDHLISARAELESRGELDAQTLIQTLKETMMYQKYYSQEQLEELRQRAQAMGAEAIEQVGRDWEALFGQLQGHLDAGTDPSDPQLVPLMARWDELVLAFTAGDAGLHQSLEQMYAQEGPQAASGGAVPAALFEYAAKIRAAQRA